MAKFYGNWSHNICPCGAKLQALLFDWDGITPLDTDHPTFNAISANHFGNCTPGTAPYLNDPNAYYGNVDDCAGYDPDTGLYNYCEF